MPGEVIVKVTNLKKYFELRQGFFSFGRESIYVKAVDDVNFEIHEGEILGLVGESGCGKTTTGRLLTRLETPTGGSVFFLGRDIALLEGQNLKVFRRNIQMVFQDPYESLNPRTSVLTTIMEPLVNHNIGKSTEERVEKVTKALEDAGLAPAKEYLNRFPHELSGGQRQRVSIARALVINPRVIVADEPVSMLDVSIRAGVLNLMLDLRDRYHIPYLFITHDIAVARYVSDKLAVMYLGRVVELGGTDSVIFEPKHPYTRALLSAVPVPDPEHKHGRITIKGEIPSATSIPLGCRFRTRCPFSFNECGWEGKDMAAYLLEEEKVSDPAHEMSKHIDEIEPNEFSLIIKVKPEGNAGKVKDFIDAKVAEMKDRTPMFQAVWSVEEMIGNREMILPTSSASITADYLAKELLERLNESVDFRSSGHPLYGTILDAVQQGSRVELTIGADEEKADSDHDAKSKIETTIGYIEDFVKHLSKSGFAEFKGVSNVKSEGSKVVIECKHSKMSARRIALEAAEMINRDILYNKSSAFYNSMLPLKPGKHGVTIVVQGEPRRWDELASELKTYFAKKAEEGVQPSKAVKEAKMRTTKGPAISIVVTFLKIAEPPLIDIGGGHVVACYLFKPVAK
jgi:peptide/nickel transport system ATP-binding protein